MKKLSNKKISEDILKGLARKDYPPYNNSRELEKLVPLFLSIVVGMVALEMLTQ